MATIEWPYWKEFLRLAAIINYCDGYTRDYLQIRIQIFVEDEKTCLVLLDGSIVSFTAFFLRWTWLVTSIIDVLWWENKCVYANEPLLSKNVSIIFYVLLSHAKSSTSHLSNNKKKPVGKTYKQVKAHKLTSWPWLVITIK